MNTGYRNVAWRQHEAEDEALLRMKPSMSLKLSMKLSMSMNLTVKLRMSE
jgi:hypothetical protein